MAAFLECGAMQFGMKAGLLYCILLFLELRVGGLTAYLSRATLTIKSVVVNTVTNRVVRLLGKDEVVRWLNLSLYQGAPSKKAVTTMVCHRRVVFFFLYI